MLEDLQSIYGIGPVLAEKLVARLKELKLVVAGKKYTNAELRNILKNKKIFDELPVAARTDLTLNPAKKVPRAVIKKINNELHKHMKDIIIAIGGSYRRGKPTSGDIDLVVIRGRRGDEVVDYIIETINKKSKKLYIYPPFARGSGKVVTIFELTKKTHNKSSIRRSQIYRVKVDIFLCDPENFVYTLLFAIGSGQFNVMMRSIAKNKGYLLNQYGLFKINHENPDEPTKIPVSSEEELFDFLDMDYKSPEERNV